MNSRFYKLLTQVSVLGVDTQNFPGREVLMDLVCTQHSHRSAERGGAKRGREPVGDE